MDRPSPRSRPILLLAALVAIAILARGWWLPWIGETLVTDDGPAKADLAVVLAGDYYGHRIEKAAELTRAGYVPAVLVDGPSGFYGAHECELAIAFIVREGYPPQWFIPLPISAHSTREEAADVAAELERRRIGSILLVTSTYHTARAARIFRAVFHERDDRISMRVVAAPDEFFRPDSWWRNREARKTVFMEWSKTIATVFGI